jgi:hypothetical protein
MRGLTLALLFALASTAFAKIDIDSRYNPNEPIVATVTVPMVENSIMHVIWEVDKPAQLRDFNGSACVWGPPGKYEITATVLLTKSTKVGETDVEVLLPGGFSRYRADFTIGDPPPEPGPGPTPGPTPNPTPSDCQNVPEDIFNNLGKRLCGATKNFPSSAKTVKQDLSKIYAEAARKLEVGEFINITAAGAYLSAERSKLLTGSLVEQFKPVEQLIISEAKQFDRPTAISFYKAIAQGLQQ